MKIDQFKRFLTWLLFVCFVILSSMWIQSCGGYSSPTGSNYNANSNNNSNGNRNGNGY